MSTIMKTRIVRIGNSKGIRIPKLFLDQTGLREDVELELKQDRIVIRAAHRAREDWDERFIAMAERADDTLLGGDQPVPTTWDEHEWQW